MLRVLGRSMYLTALNGFQLFLACAPVHGKAPPPVCPPPPPTADLACLVHDCASETQKLPVFPEALSSNISGLGLSMFRDVMASWAQTIHGDGSRRH